jgi:hypothetical protein
MQVAFDLAAFAVAVALGFVTLMWGLVWWKRFPVPIWDLARIFAAAFAFQLAIYLTYSFLLIDIQLRAYMVRISIIVICLSQGIPLWVAYRTWRYGQSHP